MGHRALVAYERHDDQYNLHYSHWGAADLQLKTRITPEAPFAGDHDRSAWAQAVLDALRGGEHDDGEPLSEVDRSEQPPTAVGIRPWVVGCSLETAIAEHLDFLHHEAFFVVDTDFGVTAYRTFWLGLDSEGTDTNTMLDEPTVGHGVLRTLPWNDGEPVGDAYDRGRWAALKEATEDMLDLGVFSERAAREYLQSKLLSWTDSDQEVLIRDAVMAASRTESEELPQRHC